MVLLCCVLSHSFMSDSLQPHRAAHQAPLSMRILQAAVLEWITMLSSRGSFQPRDGIQAFQIAGAFFTAEPLGKPHKVFNLLLKNAHLAHQSWILLCW